MAYIDYLLGFDGCFPIPDVCAYLHRVQPTVFDDIHHTRANLCSFAFSIGYEKRYADAKTRHQLLRREISRGFENIESILKRMLEEAKR